MVATRIGSPRSRVCSGEWLDLVRSLATVTEDGGVTLRLSHYLPTWVDELKAALAAELAKRAVTRLDPFEKIKCWDRRRTEDRVLGSFPGLFRLRDLSRSAGSGQTAWRRQNAALGLYAFDDQSIGRHRCFIFPVIGPASRWNTTARWWSPRKIPAKPNSSFAGREPPTSTATASSGRRERQSVQKLKPPYNLKGKLYHFSTSPNVKLGQDDCGRINFPGRTTVVSDVAGLADAVRKRADTRIRRCAATESGVGPSKAVKTNSII